MKKGTVPFALCLVLGWMAMEGQQLKAAVVSAKPLPPGLKPSLAPRSSSSSTPSGPPVDNSRPEPSALYGYVTVIDPATG